MDIDFGFDDGGDADIDFEHDLLAEPDDGSNDDPVPDDPVPEPPDDPAPDPEPGSGSYADGDDLPNLTAPPGTAGIVGDPWSCLETWHQQETGYTCAVAAQEFILDEITGVDHAESDLVAVAEAHGWLTPGGGTALGDVGRVLELRGLTVERSVGADLDQLEHAVATGKHVIVGVDADEIWQPGEQFGDDTVGDFGGYGIPGQDANHAVQVIGIDRTDASAPQVILNDPGHPDGRAVLVPADEFVDAWRDSDHFMMTADRFGVPPVDGQVRFGGDGEATARLGSTWNDGTLTDNDVIEARDTTGYTSVSNFVHGVGGYDKDPA